MVWTPRDEAELRVIAWTLVEEGLDHNKRCAICRETSYACSDWAEAVYALERWYFGRCLKSELGALLSTPAG